MSHPISTSRAFDYVRFSSGGDAAGPCAKLVTGGGDFILTQVCPIEPDKSTYVKAELFAPGKPVRRVSWQDLPQADGWEILG